MGMLDGFLPSGGTGWLNPGDPSQSTPIVPPADVQRRQILAQQLLKQGSDTSPIRSPWQGLARVLQGAMGGYDAGQADRAQQLGQSNNDVLRANAMAAMLGRTADTSDMSIGATPGQTTPALTAADAQQDAVQDGTAPSPFAAALAGGTPAPAVNTALAAALGAPAGGGSLPTFAAGAGTPTGSSPNTLAALQFYQNKGLSPVAAAALVGGYHVESGKDLNTRAANPGDGADGSTSTGIAQWNGVRAAGLKAFALANGLNPSDLNTQLQYSWNELNGPERKTLTALQQAGNDPRAATAAALGYERPAGWTPQNPLGALTANKRLAATSALAGGGMGGSPAPLRAAGGLSGLPLMASSGMGMSLPQPSGFGPLSTGINAQPAAMAFSPPSSGAPASQAITAAAGTPGGGYASQPLNVNGRMMTRQQAEDADESLNVDHTDYDYAAARAGIIGNPNAAPAFVNGGWASPAGGPGTSPVLPRSDPNAPPPSASVVAGAAMQAPDPSHIVHSEGMDVTRAAYGLPPLAAASPPAGGIDRGALMAYMADPYTPPAMQQFAATTLESAMKPRDAWQTVKDGNGSIWQRNALTGETKLLQDNSKPDNYGIVKNEDGTALAYDKADPSKVIPIGSGGSAYRAATPEEKAATGASYFGPGGKPIFAPAAAANITVGGAEKASEAAYGKAEGDEFGNILKAGQAARATQGQIALMSDAFQQSEGQIATGPFAKSILGAKQAILGATGIDLGGVPESEAVQKLGFGLATNLTKEISQRPAQQEFLKALENVPGIFMSPQGSKVMMSVLDQQAQQKIDLARLVTNPQNRQRWPDVEQAYYEAHPLISPFTGKPLAAGDVAALTASAQRAGIDPTTGRAIGAGGAPVRSAVPVRVSTPDEARRLPSGTPIILPDGSNGVVP